MCEMNNIEQDIVMKCDIGRIEKYTVEYRLNFLHVIVINLESLCKQSVLFENI